MPSYATPARVRWARSNATGELETVLAPGAMAVNWPDRKIYVGGPGGSPIRFSQDIRDYNVALHYYPGDLVFYNGAMLRNTAEAPPGAGTGDDYWEVVADASGASAKEAAITGVTQGGAVTVASTTSVAVGAGEGVVVDNTELFVPQITPVTWGGFTLPMVDPGEQWSLVGISDAGVGTAVGLSTVNFAQWRRNFILLGAALWDGGSITYVEDLSTPAGTMSEAVRDMFFASGGPYRAAGLRPSFNVGTFQLTLSEGTVFDLGENWRTTPDDPNVLSIAAQDPVTFSAVLRDSVSAAGQTVVDNANYDSGGVLTSLPSGQWTVHYLFANPGFTSVYLQYGQQTYGSAFSASEALPEDYGALVPFAGRELAILVGAVIVGTDDTSLSNGRVIGALNEPQPFVGAVAQDTTAFFLADGSRPMSGDIETAGNDVDLFNAGGNGEITNAIIQSRTVSWS